MIGTIAALSAGGLAGTFARYLAARAVPMPWGTLFVNLTGCLLIGLFDGAASKRGFGDRQGRLLVITGFCGAYTTFSALIFEADALLRTAPMRGAGYIALSVAAGLALLRAGAFLGRS